MIKEELPNCLLDSTATNFGHTKSTKVVLENIIREYKKYAAQSKKDGPEYQTFIQLVDNIISKTLTNPDAQFLNYPFNFNNIVLYIHGDDGHTMSLQTYTEVLWECPAYNINFKNSVRNLSECINFVINKNWNDISERDNIISFLLCMKTFGDLNTCLVAISDEILHFTEDSSCYAYAYLCLQESEKYIITNKVLETKSIMIKGTSYSFGQTNVDNIVINPSGQYLTSSSVPLPHNDNYESDFFKKIAENISIKDGNKPVALFKPGTRRRSGGLEPPTKEKFINNMELLSKSFFEASKSWATSATPADT
jgi:hypothetical protein